MNHQFEPFDKLIQKILTYFAGPQMLDELMKAKREFFEQAGVLDEQSPQYEVRMAQFYDWYFFTRELSGFGHTPLESCHLVRELRFDEDELSRIEILKNFSHSLFELLKIKDQDVHVKDLLKNQKLVIKNVQNTFGFDKNEIFEVRLIPFKDSFLFTKGFCFHPMEAKKYILSEIKKHRKNPDLEPEVMMVRLIKMKYKFEQYKHVSPELIYSENSVLNF